MTIEKKTWDRIRSQVGWPGGAVAVGRGPSNVRGGLSDYDDNLSSIATQDRMLQQQVQQQMMQAHAARQKAEYEESQRIMAGQGARKIWGPHKSPACGSCLLYHPYSSSNGSCHPTGVELKTTANRAGCIHHPTIAAVMDHMRKEALADVIAEKITGLT